MHGDAGTNKGNDLALSNEMSAEGQGIVRVFGGGHFGGRSGGVHVYDLLVNEAINSGG